MSKLLNFGLFSWSGVMAYYYGSKVVDLKKWRTHSMEPFINLGDWVWVDRLSEDYEGNVIAF